MTKIRLLWLVKDELTWGTEEMVISHKHKYLFIEIPHTASTAISKELCEMYGATKILHRHAHYFEFQQIATAAEKEYFTFAGIRNPLDETITKFFKMKTNHKQNFTNPSRLLKHGGSITHDALKRFDFIKSTDADFATYFKKFYRLPYTNIISLSYSHSDFIVRYENLQADFSKALKLIGIEQKRPLPRVNETSDKDIDYLSYYTPEIVDQAKYVFGPFMKKWGYDLPSSWNDHSISWLSSWEFYALDFLKSFIWKHVKRSPHFYGRLFRAVR